MRHNMIPDLISASLRIRTSPIFSGVTINSLSVLFYQSMTYKGFFRDKKDDHNYILFVSSVGPYYSMLVILENSNVVIRNSKYRKPTTLIACPFISPQHTDCSI